MTGVRRSSVKEGGTMAQRCEDDATVVVRSAGVYTSPRKERTARAREGGQEGKEKGEAAMGRPL
jgi:hypothetical protein